MTQQIATVTFHGTPLTVITQDGQQLVAMKPIVEGIGLQWEAQHKRIQRHPVLSTCMSIMDIQMPGDGQRRKVMFLPLDYLNGWLFGVDVNRVREEIRDTLIQYQRECYQVLADYWQKGEAKAPARKRQPKALPNGLTLEQQDAIKALVKARVDVLPQDKRAKGAITCWSALKSKFGCTYKQISADQFTDAASLVARLPLEGEYLGKTKDSVVEVADEDLYRVYMMICHLNAAKDAFRKELHEALLMLGSRAGGGVSEHLSEAHRQGVLLAQRYGQDMDDYQRKHRLNHYRDVA